MPYKALRNYFVIIILPFLSINTFTYANITEDNTINNQSESYVFNNVLLFPQVGLQIEGRCFAENNAGYRMETRRIIDIDILKIKKFSFSMYINEILLFDDKSSRYINPQLINYEMDYGNLRWDFKYGILSWFFDHNCSNVFNDNQTERRQLRWYGYGIRWETYGMRPGWKNSNINNNIDDSILIKNLNYKISAGKKIYTKEFNYNYLVTSAIRYDIISNYFIIPYFEGSFTSHINERVRFNRYFETGIRMRFNNGDISPYIGINHKYDIDYYSGRQIDLYYIGLRMETLLDGTAQSIRTKPEFESSFPDFHFSGSYGKYVFNDNLNFNTDILITMDFINRYKISPSFTYRLMHNSLAQSAGMFPRYIEHNIEAGISYKLEYINALVEPYCNYSRFDEGNYYNGYTERFFAGGIRFSSLAMKTGYANTGIGFDKTSDLQWINRIDWETSIERIIKEFYYNYTLEYCLKIRYNIFLYDMVISYIAAGLTVNQNNKLNTIYFVEPGIRIQNGLYWMLFYKYEYSTRTDTENGLYRQFHLIGIRLEI